MIGWLRQAFYYKEGVLYWSKERVLADKPAGYLNKEGYIEINITVNGKPKKILAHRVIFGIHHGYIPDLVDHIDRSPLNNNIENLRATSKKLNAINTGLPSNNTSGIKGVSWSKASKKWSAQIKVNGKKIHLGTFINIEDARQARQTAEKNYGFNV